MRIEQRKSLSGWERKFHNHLALEREPSKEGRGDCAAGRVLACKVVPPPARGCLPNGRRGSCMPMLCQRGPDKIKIPPEKLLAASRGF